MYTIQQTHKFSQWLTKLKDMRARIAIARRLERVFEMRVDMGAGYRLYYTMRGNELIILLRLAPKLQLGSVYTSLHSQRGRWERGKKIAVYF